MQLHYLIESKADEMNATFCILFEIGNLGKNSIKFYIFFKPRLLQYKEGIWIRDKFII